MRYVTVVTVVPEGQEGGVIDVLQHNPDIRFTGSRPGITQDALDAGAEPGDWPEDDDEPNDFDHIAERQGWNDDTRLDLMRTFIGERGLNEALSDYAAQVAEAENTGKE